MLSFLPEWEGKKQAKVAWAEQYDGESGPWWECETKRDGQREAGPHGTWSNDLTARQRTSGADIFPSFPVVKVTPPLLRIPLMHCDPINKKTHLISAQSSFVTINAYQRGSRSEETELSYVNYIQVWLLDTRLTVCEQLAENPLPPFGCLRAWQSRLVFMNWPFNPTRPQFMQTAQSIGRQLHKHKDVLTFTPLIEDRATKRNLGQSEWAHSQVWGGAVAHVWEVEHGEHVWYIACSEHYYYFRRMGGVFLEGGQ